MMKKHSSYTVCAFTIAAFSVLTTFAQEPGHALSRLIIEKDSLFWTAYNKCDVDAMSILFTRDVEFYHDKNGATFGLPDLVKALKEGLCSNPNSRLKREAVAGSVKVFPMMKSGDVYGAIISGEHVFYVVEGGKEPRLDGRAKFTQLWRLEGKEWKMARVLSYDHGPATYVNKRKAIKPATDLSSFAGIYKGERSGSGEIKSSAEHLVLSIGQSQFTLLPESASIFFMEDRDLTFEFISEKGKPTQIVVRENGKVVETLNRL